MSGAAGHSQGFWQGKRVLLTGHTGFKGAWLGLWLHRLGAEVTGISLPPNTTPSLFDLAGIEGLCASHYCDIREAPALASMVKQTRPQIVFHLAAQALVRASYETPVSTFATNVMGTVHLLEALRELDCVRVAVMVTTDKVYQNNEWAWPYREDDGLGGHDPYAASKAASEMVIASYRQSYLASRGVAVASARAGNVLGGGDWAADRLIPDAIRAWSSGRPLDIRRPQAIRPWQHVLEPVAAYLTLAERLWRQPDLAGAYNFGPRTHETASVHDVVELARAAYGRGDVHYCSHDAGPHEAGLLALEIAKARSLLGYEPRWSLQQAVERTIAWYRALDGGAQARQLCGADIAAFGALQ